MRTWLTTAAAASRAPAAARALSADGALRVNPVSKCARKTREQPKKQIDRQLSSPTIHQPQPLSAVEARRRRTEGASAERPQEMRRGVDRARGRDDEDVRAAPERLLAARGAGLGDGIRHKNVREDDEVAGRQR